MNDINLPPTLSYAFTAHGALMLASVPQSPLGIQATIQSVVFDGAAV